MSGSEARETVAWEIAVGVGLIAINRPERRNALNLQAKEGIGRAVEALTADETVRVIILTGAGGHSSSVGRDMKRFIKSRNHRQPSLLPECVDGCAIEENPVRVIEAFTDGLDLAESGFAQTISAETGRPAYRSATLLNFYFYDDFNRIQSSRRSEREAGRNLEAIWLTGQLAPSFKTISDFRRDNGPATASTQTRLSCEPSTVAVTAGAVLDPAFIGAGK